jgi:hypothetical protein
MNQETRINTSGAGGYCSLPGMQRPPTNSGINLEPSLYFANAYDYFPVKIVNKLPEKEKNMGCLTYWNSRMESLKADDFSTGSVDVHERAEGSMLPLNLASVEGNAVEKTPADLEREAKIDLWMNDIKSFIRDIDVTTL